ncbi:MAG: hypothetical protein L3J57_06520 [Desulfuromusa sp.]|nr:hypothetical protein [Desulfuromusa sp.]
MFELILIGSLAGLIMGTVGVGGGALIIFCLSVFAKFPPNLLRDRLCLLFPLR